MTQETKHKNRSIKFQNQFKPLVHS